jgi:SAM-dependent methyltransferase
MDSIDNQTAYWDKVADRKAFTHPLDTELLQSLTTPDSRILDLGCGYGRSCTELVELGFHNVVGVDSSKEMIKRGLGLDPRLKLVACDGTTLPFAADSFDVVILFAVLTCISSNKGQIRFVGEASRVLQSGGILYVSDYWLQSDQRNKGRYARFADKYDAYGVFELDDGAICRHHSREWIDNLFADYEKIRCTDIEVRTMNGSAASAFQLFVTKNKNYGE